MPCKLKVISGTTFEGTVNNEITVALTGPSGSGAKINHIRYAGTEVDATPPYQFTIKKGSKLLVVLAEASKPGATLRLSEVCGNKKQLLHEFHFDPLNPARGYIIKGVSA